MLTLKKLLLDIKNQLSNPWTGLILRVLPEEWLVNKIASVIPISVEEQVEFINRLQSLAAAEGKTIPQLLTSESFLSYIDGFINIIDVDLSELKDEIVDAAGMLQLK